MKRHLAWIASAGLALLLSVNARAAGVPMAPVGNNPLAYPGQTAGAVPLPDAPLPGKTLPKFQGALPVPVKYIPDKASYPGFDYYEIKYAEVTGAGPFLPPGVASSPPGTQWLGLRDPVTLQPLYTPVWGFGATKAEGTELGAPIATYPSMTIRARKGTPVKVKWVNELPDQHLFCPQPTNANWPCAIDRTLMGTLAYVTPGVNGQLPPPPGVPNEVTGFGGPQQPDNAVVVHLHGGEIPPESDGFAELWFGNRATAAAYTPAPIDPITGLPVPVPQPLNPAIPGVPATLTRPVGDSMVYNYPMVQNASTIWFHDHALGKTRVNVAAGPAGFFIVEDPVNEPAGLPGGKYDVEIAVQDRAFNVPQPGTSVAAINFPNGLNQPIVAPLVPEQTPLTPGAVGTPGGTVDAAGAPRPAEFHPQWVPEYFGDVSIVNGMAWPYLDVEPRKYRFRFLNGSNARCWSMARSDGGQFFQIATEQGYVRAPVAMGRVVFCPGERMEVVTDFTGLRPGTLVTLNNIAAAPFPRGVPPSGADVGTVMQFRVVAPDPLAPPDRPLPALLDATYAARLLPGAPVPAGWLQREMVLNEVLDALTLAPLRVQIDGKTFEDAVTETPTQNATEVWRFVNTTGDAHPIHLHLVRFQIVSRQKFDAAAYSAVTGFGVPGRVTFTPAPVARYLIGRPRGPDKFENGWKDTAISYPGEVLTIVSTWHAGWNTTVADVAGNDGFGNPVYAAAPAYLPVDSGPYVWHCHIVDHEDNEMMRPVMVTAAP